MENTIEGQEAEENVRHNGINSMMKEEKVKWMPPRRVCLPLRVGKSTSLGIESVDPGDGQPLRSSM